MDEAPPVEPCSKKPDFPKKAFITSFFYKNKESFSLYPMHEVFEDFDYFSEKMKEAVDRFIFVNHDFEVPSEIMALPINFERLYPLKKEYWEGEHEHYKEDLRTHLFLELVVKPQLHNVLVVPTYYQPEDDNFSFEAALPIKLNTSDDEIEHFMQHSDYNVNITASHSAIYSLGDPIRFNWRIETSETAKKTRNKEKIIN